METVIGDNCAILANAHVGHDCRIGDHVVLVNNVMVAGHVTLGDYVICAGGSAVIQFTRVGPHAFVGGLTGLENDLIPYGLAMGNRAHLAGLNMIGLRRRDFSRNAIHDLRRAYRALFAVHVPPPYVAFGWRPSKASRWADLPLPLSPTMPTVSLRPTA